MDRREFVNFLALTAAGAAAMPTQVAAFERYYNANTPFLSDSSGLVCVDEIFLAGMASRSMRMNWRFNRTGEVALNLGLNAFGGILRWVAAPDQKIVTLARDFTWWVKSPDVSSEDGDLQKYVEGHILYIDQDAVRHTHLLPGDGHSILGV